MKLGSVTRGLDRSGIEERVAGLEQRALGTDGVHDSGRIVTQNLNLALRRLGALAHLVVSRVGRDRLHGDPDVTAGRFGLGCLEIDESVRGVDLKRSLVSDGLHGWSFFASKLHCALL